MRERKQFGCFRFSVSLLRSVISLAILPGCGYNKEQNLKLEESPWVKREKSYC